MIGSTEPAAESIGHVEAFGLEVSLVECNQERCRRAFKFEVEGKFHGRLRAGGADHQAVSAAAAPKDLQKKTCT